MPISTLFNNPPYYDDYTPSKDYYRILFKTGVAVQARELNQFQDILQNQIEQFGDSVFTRGTIIDGCNFIFYDNFPYVKLADTDINGVPIDVALFNGFNVSDSNNLIGLVINQVAGFQATDPDLNTIYLRYLNSGNTATGANATAFTPGSTVTIYNGGFALELVNITGASQGFANTDSVVIVSALEISNTTGGQTFANGSGGSNTFNVGDVLFYNELGVANIHAIILEVNATANAQTLILKIQPFANDLSNATSSVVNWTFPVGTTILDTTTNTSLIVGNQIGNSASASLITTGIGSVFEVNLNNQGQGYYVPPFIGIQSTTGSLANLALSVQNYLSKVQVATTLGAVGNGYGFGITSGVIYQKGYFLRVAANTIIVDKYSNAPDQIVVGFDTQENVVNSNVDQSLLDFNQAPGADRLNLEPVLVVETSNVASINALFFPIVEWSNGIPFKQNRTTQFTTIETEMASRMSDEAGDFVLDPFLISSVSVSGNLASESNSFTLVIDPGSAYIDGYKVKTTGIYSQTANKSTTTANQTNNPIAVNYGNYVLVSNFAGSFTFQDGAQVSLRDTATKYLSNTSNIGSGFGAITPAGTEIGQARIRSIIYDNRAGIGGTPGTVGAAYRLYLFNIVMNAGKNFNNVLSISSNNGSSTGVADLRIAGLQEPSNNSLIVPAGANALVAVSSVSFPYRATGTIQANTSGNATAAANSGESFLNSGSLLFDTILVPQVNVVFVNATGNVFVQNTFTNVVGTGFSAVFAPGDYVTLANSSTTFIKNIVSITNNTLMTIDSPVSATANINANIAITLPQNVPISLVRAGRSIIISPANVMTINLGNSIPSIANMSLTYTAIVNSATPITKTVNRDIYVAIQCNTNLANTTGPWVLGIPEIIRLKNVYLGLSNTGTDVTSNFIINGGQLENWIDYGTLAINPNSNLILAANAVLLVRFDCLTSSGPGVGCISSYNVNDSIFFTSSSSTLNTLEIPELYGNQGDYYDLRDCIDFRPIVVNTAVISTSNTLATLNPVVPTAAAKFGNTSSPANNKRFPHPISTVNTAIQYYLARTDKITVNANGTFNVLTGKPDIISKVKAPADAINSLTLNTLIIPPYPSLPASLSANVALISDTKIVNQKFAGTRVNDFTISTPVSASQIATIQPQGYTMKEIGALEQRISDLEQVVLISLLSNTVNSANTTTFGFLADDFSTTQFSDINNPEYNASVINGLLGPKVFQQNLPFEFVGNFGQYATLPFIPFPLVVQTNATDGCSTNATSISQIIQPFNAQSPSGNTAFNIITVGGIKYKEYVWDQYAFKCSATTGPAEIFIDGGAGAPKVYVFQSNSSTLPVTGRNFASNTTLNNPTSIAAWLPLLVTTSDSSVNATTADKQLISDVSALPFKLVIHPAGIGNGIQYLGKLNFTYTPSLGQYLFVVIVKGKGSYNLWTFLPIDEPSLIPCMSENQPVPVSYLGHMTVAPSTFKIKLITKTVSSAQDHNFNTSSGGRISTSSDKS